jgi:hypothetical protein
MSAVLLASGLMSASSGGGSSVVVNSAGAGAGQAVVPHPAVISPFSDEELAMQAEIEAEVRAAELARQSGFTQPEVPSELPQEPQPPAREAPVLRPYSQATPWLQRGGADLGDASEWQALQAEAAIESALEWAPIPQAPPKSPQVTCTSMVTGNWSSTGTWSCGHVPTSSDDAAIATGTVVTIDTAAVALDVTVNTGGVLQYDPTTARSLTLGVNATVSAGGAFQAGLAGVTHTLSIGGNLANNGTINFSQTAVVAVTFTGASSATWTGDGNYNLTAAGGGVTINKGTSSASVLTFTPGLGVFTIDGSSSNGFLNITNGTFEIAGANTFSNKSPTAAYYPGHRRLPLMTPTQRPQRQSNQQRLVPSMQALNIAQAQRDGRWHRRVALRSKWRDECGWPPDHRQYVSNPRHQRNRRKKDICTVAAARLRPFFGFLRCEEFFNMSGGDQPVCQYRHDAL